jgi:hypothetical protein
MNTPAGSTVVFGRLKKRMEPRLVRSIAKLTASFPAVKEALLVGCFGAGMAGPAEVLALIFSTSRRRTKRGDGSEFGSGPTDSIIL